MFSKYIARVSTLLATTAAMLLSIPAHALDMNLSQQPLFLSPTVAPLNMLVVGRDHKLYYEAYNDYTDLDGDGTLDMRFKPSITYYGYFDSGKCYSYVNGIFDPQRLAATGNTCTVDSEWSGNFLNYVTTARIDALRKVLYGGFRSTDSATETVLQRTYLPQDAHSWGKEYTSVEVDGYDISLYTPLTVPTSGNRHLFANTTLLTSSPDTSNPLMRVLTNRSERIWNWVSIERPVAGSRMFHGGSGTVISPAPTDYNVRVKVCKTGLLEANCQAYGTTNKPIGLLQEFGSNDAMYFGLITGSYSKNTSGGVLRRRMDSIGSEINADGTFKTDDPGIIATLNRMRVTGFGGSYEYNCGWNAASRTINEGECQMWGNPIAEMMYESLRYFAGQNAATSDFGISFGAGEESELLGGGLPVATWNDPYSGTNAHPYCAKPFQTVVSDINPSYDTDQLPGIASDFGSFGTGRGSLSGLNVSALGQTIWTQEFGSAQDVFIGQSGAVTDGAPTVKRVTSFGNIRGLSPEEPTKRGGYYAASVAYYGRINDISTSAGGPNPQNVQTFAVALASPLPKIRIPVGNSAITLVPFAKSVAGSGISASSSFQPTDQIVDFYVDTLTPTYGKFRVNFEDVEQGADHDMDAIAIYEYTVSGSTVTVKVTSEYAAGGITQHMGYVISGTTHDGIYLEVLDQRDGDTANDTDYFLDTPDAFTGTPPAPNTGVGRWNDGVALPFVHERTFSPGTSAGAILLNDPLWYAAKWGGFTDSNNNNIPDVRTEWDANQTGAQNGVPDNYFLVTNALTLSEQLREAFREIMDRSASASSASVNSGSITTDTRVYQAKFNTRNWNSELKAFGINPTTGQVNSTFLWDAGDPNKMPAATARKIITVNSDGAPVPFKWDSLDDTRRTQLADTELVQKTYVNYLRGDPTGEGTDRNSLRYRGTSKLGDIVGSAPLFVGAPRARYPDNMPGTTPYSAFAQAKRTRNAMLYVGANDGMLHGFDAGGLVDDPNDSGTATIEDPNGGKEVFAFIPKSVFPNLKLLTRPNYSHRYYVDGSPNSNDVFFGTGTSGSWHTVLVGGLNLGGQGIYALDITDPAVLASAEDRANTIHLWEFTDENDADLGYTYSQPAIVRMQDGSWAAVFGNGYNNTVADGRPSTTGNAVLYIVNIETGALIKKIDTDVGMSDPRSGGKPNGLATPTMVDVDGDRIVDFAYAGDLLGNLWKFNLRSTDNGQWGIAFSDANGRPQPIFSATDSNAPGGNIQPITVRPEVARGPYGAGVIVVFGTGKFLESGDKDVPTGSTQKQSFYGLVDQDSYDRSTNTYAATDKIVRSRLVQQTIDSETASPMERSTSMRAMNANGFLLDLVYQNRIQGERSVTDPLVRGDRVIFTTLIPNSVPCEFGGRSWLMVLDLLSGGRLPDAQLDGDGDGDIDANDQDTSGVGSNEILSRPESLLCLVGDCTTDRLLSSGSSGALSERNLRSIRGLQGRQSWRQIR